MAYASSPSLYDFIGAYCQPSCSPGFIFVAASPNGWEDDGHDPTRGPTFSPTVNPSKLRHIEQMTLLYIVISRVFLLMTECSPVSPRYIYVDSSLAHVESYLIAVSDISPCRSWYVS